jgi:hypothetical protein
MNATGSPQLNYIATHKTSVWEACGFPLDMSLKRSWPWWIKLYMFICEDYLPNQRRIRKKIKNQRKSPTISFLTDFRKSLVVSSVSHVRNHLQWKTQIDYISLYISSQPLNTGNPTAVKISLFTMVVIAQFCLGTFYPKGCSHFDNLCLQLKLG